MVAALDLPSVGYKSSDAEGIDLHQINRQPNSFGDRRRAAGKERDKRPPGLVVISQVPEWPHQRVPRSEGLEGLCRRTIIAV